MKIENPLRGGPIQIISRAFNVPKIQELTAKMRELKSVRGEKDLYSEIRDGANILMADYLIRDERTAWLVLTAAEIAGVAGAIAVPFAIYVGWVK